VRRAARVSLVRLAAHVSTLRGRIEAAGIDRTFFICSTPRTGSTMLGNLLADTGLVGRAGEYFGEFFRRDVVPGLSRRRFDNYLVDCTRHARGTGTLGIKLHWDQVEVFVHLLRLRRGLRGFSDRQVIEAVFPTPRFVWITREDTLAQGVSWWKAITSGRWTDGRPVTGEPSFDVDGIAGRVRRIDEHTEAWRRWFETLGIEPLRLTYEELAADPAGTARRVLEFVGVDVPADLAVAPRTEQQADAVNEDWVRRYRGLAGPRSGFGGPPTT
jgi:LPS sulfotransferase NodH